jgi:hypothetical protein
MDRKVVGALAMALVAALALASCGSGSLSRADLVKQANAICRHRAAQIASMQRRYANNFRGLVAAALPVASKGLDELRKLKPPSSLKTRYEQFLALERAQLDQVRAALVAQKTGRRPRTAEPPAQIHRRGDVTRELGLTACI